jgi:transcription antitermination protein NusB
MLNRRHLRIKAFQTLYSYQQVERKDLKQFEKSLLESILSVHKCYVLHLMLITELDEFEQNDVNDRSAKYLPTEADKTAIPYLKNNKFIQLLNESAEFKELKNKYKVNWTGEEVLLRELFNKIKESDIFKSYTQSTEHSYSEDKELITSIYKHIIFTYPLLEQYLEEHYLNWLVDKSSVEGMVLKSIRSFSESNHAVDILPITANWDEDKEYIMELFFETVKNDEECDKLISNKTQNWELDRIALVDVILMKMAITELVHFNSIPTKVTMNEYIDISKEFSTPKSKGFINGILDKILIDLKTEGKINKIGRGLIE